MGAGISGGRPLVKTKEKVFRETQLMFLQQPGEESDAPQLPQLPSLDLPDLTSFKADKPESSKPESSKSSEEQSPKGD